MKPFRPISSACALAVAVSAVLFADALIDAARQDAADQAQQLPGYSVTRLSTRTRGSRSVPKYTPEAALTWAPKASDVVSSTLTRVGAKETCTNIVVNGVSTKQLPSGLSSPADFAAQMLGILAPESYPTFKNKRQELIDAKPLWRYDFSITQPYSTWHIDARDDTGLGSIVHYAPAYSGSIWIHKDTGQVRRTRMQTGKLPDNFPLDTFEIVTDYDRVRIGQNEYLMPIHSDAYTCPLNASICFKDETILRNYRQPE